MEAQNARCNMVYHKASQRGGGAMQNTSHILPIARYYLRNLMWKSGIGQLYFEDIKYKCESTIPRLSLDDFNQETTLSTGSDSDCSDMIISSDSDDFDD